MLTHSITSFRQERIFEASKVRLCEAICWKSHRPDMRPKESSRLSFRDWGRIMSRGRRKGAFCTAHQGKLRRTLGGGCEQCKTDFSSRRECSKVFETHARRKKRFLSFLSSWFSLFFLSPFSSFFSFAPFPGSLSSRAAFRVFGRALNWAPFKTWELFIAPPRYASAVCYLASRACYVTRVTSERREKCRAVDGTLWLSIRY